MIGPGVASQLRHVPLAEPTVRIVEPLLGTRAEVAVTASLSQAQAAAEDAVVQEVTRLEAIFTVFDKASALHAYRRSGATSNTELLRVIATAAWWQQRTGGAFHPSAGALHEVWDRAEADNRDPSPEHLAKAAQALTQNPNTRNPSKLDLNGIAKGWIAERAVIRTFARFPDTATIWLNIGGDVIHRGKGSVRVGIEDPHRPYDNVAPLATVEVSGEALATSGGSRRWWTIDGRRYSKVLDPRTGRPVDHIASATVVATDGATADALATSALVLDPDETLVLASEVGAACFLVDRDGEIIASSDRFKPLQTK